MPASADLRVAKGALRREIRQKKAGLDPAWIRPASERIAAFVRALEVFVEARVVFGYWARSDEVQTEALLRAAWAAGKRVCLPAFAAGEGRYRPAWLEPGQALVVRRYGVAEPDPVLWVEGERIDLALVPGLAFDRAGHRLGHGGGYYDRMLAGPPARGSVLAGLAFEFQVVTQVPTGDMDIPVDIVVTELGVYAPACRGVRRDTDTAGRGGPA